MGREVHTLSYLRYKLVFHVCVIISGIFPISSDRGGGANLQSRCIDEFALLSINYSILNF